VTIVAGLVWAFFYLKDAHPLGALGSRLGRDELENVSIRFKDARLVGRSEGRTVWSFQARTIDLSRDRRLATFKGVTRGTLLADGRPIASLSAGKVVYNTYTRNVSAPGSAEFQLTDGPSFRVRDVYWNAAKSKLVCRGVDMELAGSTLHGERMTADLDRKELTIGKVNGTIKLED
jgi:hypothetical protein